MKSSPSCAHVLQKKNLEFGHFTSLFCWRRQRNVQKHKRTCTVIVFVNETDCFVAFSLPPPSSLPKLSNVSLTTRLGLFQVIDKRWFFGTEAMNSTFLWCCFLFVFLVVTKWFFAYYRPSH